VTRSSRTSNSNASPSCGSSLKSIIAGVDYTAEGPNLHSLCIHDKTALVHSTISRFSKPQHRRKRLTRRGRGAEPPAALVLQRRIVGPHKARVPTYPFGLEFNQA
jgi:hypothetical protein